MKPIRLEMRGINSFKETQIVDFSKLAARGIFGIFGPTGSGKSTILDAMTLALYSETARKSNGYINSDSEDLYVSFEFEVQTGSGRAVYVVERGKSRQKNGGIKGTIDRLYRKDGPGEIYERHREVNKAVEEILGLTMDDFTRSVVLPQGKFSDFLMLKGSDRKRMLERILKLQEFGELLTNRVKYRRTENARLLYGAKESLEAYGNLEMDRLDEFKKNLKDRAGDLENLTSREKEIEEELNRVKEFWQNKDRLSDAEEKLWQFEQKAGEMEALLDAWKTAEKVRELMPYFREKKAAQREIEEIEGELKKLKADRARLETLEKENETRLEEILHKKQKEFEPLIRKSLLMERLIEEDLKWMDALLKENRLREKNLEKALREMESSEDDSQIKAARMEMRSREIAEKKEKLDILAREHLIVVVGKNLQIGDACPVCGNEVGELAFLKEESVHEAKKVMEKCEKELEIARDILEREAMAFKSERENRIRLAADIENTKARLEADLEREKILEKKIREVFGRNDPREALEKVKNALKDLAETEEAALGGKESLAREIHDVNGMLSDLSQGIEKQKERLRMASRTLGEGLEKTGIRSEEEMTGCDWNDEALESMKSRYETWRRQKERLHLLTEEIQAALKESSVKGSRESFEELKSAFEGLRIERQRMHETVIRLKERTEQMEKNLQTVRELEKKKKRMEKRDDLMGEIMKLLKGNAFVGFLAMRHLRYIVLEASKRLMDITGGRYLLEIDSQGDFVVCDHYSGGVRRGCDTLSGGETFIVSLALALALSAKIQMNRFNSLEFFFLDEGFGTLDPEVLDVVMDSLERVREKDLSVGLISHVEALKDRVPVKLLVEPAEPGVSGSTLRLEYM